MSYSQNPFGISNLTGYIDSARRGFSVAFAYRLRRMAQRRAALIEDVTGAGAPRCSIPRKADGLERALKGGHTTGSVPADFYGGGLLRGGSQGTRDARCSCTSATRQTGDNARTCLSWQMLRENS
jgi:hypothetical protein